MKQLIALLNIVLGAWTAVSPWVLGYESAAAVYADLATGIALVALGAAALLAKGKKAPGALLAASAAVGLWLLVSAFVFGPVRPSAIVCGALVALASLFASQVRGGEKLVVTDKSGKVMVEMDRIEVDGDTLAIKGKLFGSMPSTMYVTPAQLWRLLGMVTFPVLKAMPGMLSAGRKGR